MVVRAAGSGQAGRAGCRGVAGDAQRHSAISNIRTVWPRVTYRVSCGPGGPPAPRLRKPCDREPFQVRLSNGRESLEAHAEVGYRIGIPPTDKDRVKSSRS